MRRAFAHQEHTGRGYRRMGIGAALGMIALAFMPITCAGLGFWQVQRLRWKEELIEDVNDKLQRAPITLPRNVKYA